MGIVRFALEQPLRGAVNAVSPGCVRMREFAAALGGALGRPAWLPVPLRVLRIALGEVASALSPGQRVIPRRALDAGYAFRHPTLEGALEACLG